MKLALALLLCAVGVVQAAPQGGALFDPVASVVMSPRCINCHQADAPRQKDKGVLHAQQVVRGSDGHGSAALHCAACHQAGNTAEGKVPGAPNWHLAPLSMRWQGLDKKGVCQQMRDPARNGNRRTGAQVIEHMKTDPLVLWAWNPGANRTTPPMSHDDFIQVLRQWARAGMPCPD
jgi:mono/diheme cytochrome c family protein